MYLLWNTYTNVNNDYNLECAFFIYLYKSWPLSFDKSFLGNCYNLSQVSETTIFVLTKPLV